MQARRAKVDERNARKAAQEQRQQEQEKRRRQRAADRTTMAEGVPAGSAFERLAHDDLKQRKLNQEQRRQAMDKELRESQGFRAKRSNGRQASRGKHVANVKTSHGKTASAPMPTNSPESQLSRLDCGRVQSRLRGRPRRARMPPMERRRPQNATWMIQ